MKNIIHCEHLDDDNKKDCSKKAKYICACCGAGVCEKHKTALCPYGGERFIEL